ncbi:MAG TPA: hypothetical protein ENI41_00950, partial [Deltaproteobacteria bacterium]|nr:hypothetical protein [Deltaproteobacteria bacterium]
MKEIYILGSCLLYTSVAVEYGVEVDGKSTQDIAKELAYAMEEDYGTRKKALTLLKRAPEKRRQIWDK